MILYNIHVLDLWVISYELWLSNIVLYFKFKNNTNYVDINQWVVNSEKYNVFDFLHGLNLIMS
jgi:hypothetical protein